MAAALSLSREMRASRPARDSLAASDDAHERRRCVPRRPLPSGRSGRLGAFRRDERAWFKADVSISLADRRTRKSATTRLSTRSRRTETSRERARSCDLAPSPRRREPRDSLTAPRATMFASVVPDRRDLRPSRPVRAKSCSCGAVSPAPGARPGSRRTCPGTVRHGACSATTPARSCGNRRPPGCA